MEVKEIIVRVLSVLVSVFVVVLNNTATLVGYCNANYPQVTQIVIGLVAIYLMIKLCMKAFRLWVRLMIQTLKFVMVVSFIGLCFIVYLRGFNRFIDQDIPFITNILKDPQSFKLNFSYSNWFAGFEYGGYINDFLQDSTFKVEIDHDYIDYLKDQKEKLLDEDFIQDTYENFNDYVKSYNIEYDVNEIGNHIYEFLGR
ncbi:hypothetical protein HYPBUDRAFT_104660 [Hyphopichia burtonii NRRL Y-1933]|uniref:Uncharacterized protein n=1 Tax=Hyphopichia burtonii NRRL Y-1933 TaxID=984485 RepID=A0A1E4RNW5_9ASCO|nr:hypothetical protein HYPBUDRAFT_104660 [Hyphopichia burtonii NRRL Y-1933]ODV68962.1 hypothetical protein HYPBUDRAFT_104660 [Hyphopichia burtonii NRRL Y-1933]